MRDALNPISSGLTKWWLGVGRRQVPPRPAPSAGTIPAPGEVHAFFGVPSPGKWVAPAGQRPGWDWLPEHGAMSHLRVMPRWVRVWYRIPFIDRYAYEWMWWHGGWAVLEPAEPPRPDSGVREPRRPRPADPAGAAARAEMSE